MHIGDARVDDSAILFELKQELADAYHLFEQDFATSYLKHFTGNINDVQVKTTAARGMHVEFTVSKVVQYSFEITRRGVWRFMSRDGMESQCFYYKEVRSAVTYGTSTYVADMHY